MTRSSENLLARLAAGDLSSAGPASLAELDASDPEHEDSEGEQKLDALLRRLNTLTDPDKPDQVEDAQEEPQEDDENEFTPVEPTSLREAKLTDSQVESLVLKYLLAVGDASGRDVADQICLPFVLIDELLRQMKIDQIVVHKGSSPMNDYLYQLSDLGRERARRHSERCTYFGAAPVALSDYVASVEAQSLAHSSPSEAALHRAFDGLLLNRKMLDRLGPAINSGRGLFLFGSPGNGKTSVAERVTGAFGAYVWIPRAIGIDGEIIRLHDPVNHNKAPVKESSELIDRNRIDRRWVRIERPTIVAGGELTMSALEVTMNTSTGISEAPLQLKSNCGTLVIDDFGRQRMPVEELLNRWIVPLEKRYDYLNLPNGKKIIVPFDQLIVFSTNLEPRDLVDEAFLRRIPYKIEAIDPTEEEFRVLFTMMAPKMGFEFKSGPVDYLIEKYYKKIDRNFRFCQPRDLLLQVKNYCAYHKKPLELTEEHFDRACENYFAVM